MLRNIRIKHTHATLKQLSFKKLRAHINGTNTTSIDFCCFFCDVSSCIKKGKSELHPFRKRNTITKEDNNDEGKNHFVVKCHKHLMLDFVDICRYHQIKKIEYCE